jgi:hypothetical protein
MFNVIFVKSRDQWAVSNRDIQIPEVLGRYFSHQSDAVSLCNFLNLVYSKGEKIAQDQIKTALAL